MQSHFNKKFILKQIIFEDPAQNPELIFSIDPKLLYHINQLWSAFERNDVNEWFRHLAFLAFTPNKGPQPKGAPLAETPKYDKKKEIREAYYEWLGVIKKYDYDYNPPVNNFQFKIPGITDNYQIRQGQKPATNI